MQPGINNELNFDSKANLLIAAGFKSEPYQRELYCGMCRKTIYSDRNKFETIYVVEQSVKYGHLCHDCWQKYNETQ
jgi:hypothetical protein